MILISRTRPTVRIRCVILVCSTGFNSLRFVGAPLPFRLKINENIVAIVETEDKETGTEGKCYIQMSLHCDRSLSETSTYYNGGVL